MGNLFQELKRRKVFRVAAAYLIIGWVILQVADTIAPIMNLPEVATRFVLFLLIVLFPITLFLAWVFDIEPTDGVGVAKSSAIKSFIPMTFGIAVIGVAAFFWLFVPQDSNRDETIVSDASPAIDDEAQTRTSLAVLPFSDLSPEGDQEYFGDGIAEAILNALVPLDEFSVASRTSAFAFKEANRNLVEIANILNVANILEGSVRKAGDNVLITAQLIDATTDRNLWSGTYNHELTVESLFATQEEIANAIVAALSEELGLEAHGNIEILPGTENLDAYDLYLQAERLEAIWSTENARRSVELLERAVSLDPEFADAWALLAWNLNGLPTWDHSLNHVPFNQRAIEAARRALLQNPSNQLAYTALADAYFMQHEWEQADEVLAQAEPETRYELIPAVMGLGYLSEANELAQEMARREPNNGFYHLIQALFFDSMGYTEEAILQYEQAILEGYNGGAEQNLALAFLRLGQSPIWSAIWAREFEAEDPEMLPLLPYFHEVLTAEGPERTAATNRLVIAARELGLQIDDLTAIGPRFGLRAQHEIVVELGRSDVLADHFWSNGPKMWMWVPSLHEFRQSEPFREKVRSSGMLTYWQANRWPDLCRPLGDDDFECD